MKRQDIILATSAVFIGFFVGKFYWSMYTAYSKSKENFQDPSRLASGVAGPFDASVRGDPSRISRAMLFEVSGGNM